MLKKLFLFCFILLSNFAHTQIVKSPTPHWVEIQPVNESPNIDLDETTQGTVLLQYNEQVNVPLQEAYIRIVTKITDNVGIQTASSINTGYDPTYQSLRFHQITIKRDGKIIDKLNISDFQILRRESNADNYIYDGSLSAMLNMSDVRTGDIVDYSYSIKGFNPIHGDSFSSSFVLNDSEPVGEIYVRLISKDKLSYDGVNQAPEPTITNENGNTIYVWKAKNTRRIEFENYTPSWKLLYDNIFVSTHNSWADVVDWGVDVYKINAPVNSDLKEAINTINTSNKTEGEKIKSTLDFVQNEIRYLGLESGIGSYKPSSPNKVFEQRFGDCKDKSVLMVSMLNQMGIEAYPMLVSTTLSKTITEVLPSQKLFDHCVVKVVDENNSNLYYDPTITNQGGTYKSTYFPDYEYGLVLKEGNTAFDTIVSSYQNTIEIEEVFNLDEIGGDATLNITTTYHENEADNMRAYFKNNSISAIKKEYENYYSNYFSRINATKNPEILDNLNSNLLVIKEAYKIDSIWVPMADNPNNIGIYFQPTSIIDILFLPTETDRKTELALAYPALRKHHIKVNFPTSWNISPNDNIIASKGFYYELDVNYDKKLKQLDINHSLDMSKSFIEVSEYSAYVKDLNVLDKNLTYQIFIPKGYASGVTFSKESKTGFIVGFIIVLLVGLTIIGLVGYAIYKTVRKNK